jgi:hypothetical protein
MVYTASDSAPAAAIAISPLAQPSNSPNRRYVATGGEAIILRDAQTQTKLVRFAYPERP